MANLDFSRDDYFVESLSQPITLPQSLYAIQQAALLRLKTKRGTYWADPLLGSRLHLLKREKDVPRILMLAQQYASEALLPMQTEQRVGNINISANKIKVSMLELHIEMTTQHNQKLKFSYFVAVGG